MTMTIVTTTLEVGKWMNPFPMSLDSCTITCPSQQATVKRSGINSKVLSNLVLSKEGAVITARKPTNHLQKKIKNHQIDAAYTQSWEGNMV